MKGLWRDNDVQVVEVLENCLSLITPIFDSLGNFRDLYPKGSMLYIDTGYNIRSDVPVLLYYDYNSVGLRTSDRMHESIISWKYLDVGESYNGMFNNEVDVYFNRFSLNSNTNFVSVRLDGEERGVPSRGIALDFEDGVCYIDGDACVGGVEESIFQRSLIESTRSFEEIDREFKAVEALIDEMPNRSDFCCNSGDRLPLYFYQDFIPGNLI